MQACPVNAIAIDPDHGAKIVLPQVCVGCHLCTIACPFGTVFTLPTSGTKASKCNLCGGQPACAAACPTSAIEWTGTAKGEWLGPWGDKVERRFEEAVAGGTR
jgi:Fe-S-cluster-containing hydrogenase component 2